MRVQKRDTVSLGAASEQLDRVLGFFSRVDAKVTALFAVDTGMLALLALNAKADDVQFWYICLSNVIAIGALAVSLYFLYQANSPRLEGGTKSLIYFREIAGMTEANYIDEMQKCDEERYTKELLAQVWRNSEILTHKFDCLKYALWSTAASLPAWLIALSAAALKHASLAVN